MATFLCLDGNKCGCRYVVLVVVTHGGKECFVLLTLYTNLSQKQVLPARARFKKLRRRKINNPKINQVLLTGYKLGFSVQTSKRPT